MRDNSPSSASPYDAGSSIPRLDPRDIALIAERVAELLSRDGGTTRPARLVDAAAVAEKLGVDRDWVYAHARELGGVRLGGARGRLRFDLERVERALQCRDEHEVKRTPTRRRPRGGAKLFSVELLPCREVSSPAQAKSGRATRQRPRP